MPGELGLGHDLSGVQHEVAQQAELGAGEGERLPAVRHRLSAFVEPDLTDLQDAAGRSVVAAHDGVDARAQLLDMKRLRQVIVGAGLESIDLLVPGIARRENDHRQPVAAPAPVRQHLEARALRQPEIEHRGVVGFDVSEMLGVHAVVGGVDGEARGLERLLQARAQLGIVLHYQ